MSLFPAANLDLKDPSHQEEPNSNWLKNESYEKPLLHNLPKLKEQKFVKAESQKIIKTTSKSIKKKSKREKKKILHKITREEVKVTKKNAAVSSASSEKISTVVDCIPHQGKLYMMDKTMDKDNCYFHRPYKIITPKFYRPIIECVGVPTYRSLIVGEMKKIKDEKMSKKHRFSDRYFYKNNRKILSSLRNCEIINNDRKFNIHDDYIRIQFEGENVGFEDDDKSAVIESDPLKLKVEHFNKTLRNNPNDTAAWLGLLNLQHDVIATNLKNRERLIIEKKVAILERAISENKSNVLFRRMQLELKAKISSDYSTMEKEWSNLVFKFPDNLELWEGFIQYLTTSSTIKFTIQKTEKSFGRCISVLRAMQVGSFRTTSSIAVVEKNLFQIFRQYIDFLRSSGYIEKSILCVIYLLEFNFRKPEKCNDNFNDLLESLEKYYLSSQPKLGQENSTGWGEWHMRYTKGGWTNTDEEQQDEGSDEEDEMDYEESLIDDKLSLAENWLKIESHRGSLKCLKSIHKFSSQKSENFIPFTDIKQSIFLVSNNAMKAEMCKMLLHILGARIRYNTTDDVMFKKQGLYTWTNSSQILGQTLTTMCLFKPILFSRSETLQALPRNGAHEFILDIFEQLIISSKEDIVLRKSLEIELVEYFENRLLSLSSPSMKSERKTSGKEARKTAKYILKKDQDLFEVWTKLCQIEWMLGNYEESVRILQHIILLTVHDIQHNISTIFKTVQFEMILKMFCSIALLCWKAESDGKKALSIDLKNKILSTFAGFGDEFKFSTYFKRYSSSEALPFSPAEIIKVSNGWKKIFTLTKSNYKPSKDCCAGPSVFINASICYIIFNILFNRATEVPSLFEVVITVISSCEANEKINCDLEHILIVQMFFLHYAKFSRQITRKHAYFASKKFPNNPVFAYILTEIDMPSYLSANAHRHFNAICKSDLIIPWLSYINFELQRKYRSTDENESRDLLPLDSGNHKLNNVFKKASSTQSPAIWRLFLGHEAKKTVEDASDVYFKAIDSCPWAEKIYKDFIKINPSMLSDVIDTMTDKGLMVRTQIEEVELMMTS